MPEQRPKTFLVRFGTLRIQTDAATFETLRNAIIEHAGLERELVEREAIQGISIHNADAEVEPKIERGYRDQVALIGCGLVSCAIIFVFFAGVLALLGLT
jgi:hypothetical protein